MQRESEKARDPFIPNNSLSISSCRVDMLHVNSISYCLFLSKLWSLIGITIMIIINIYFGLFTSAHLSPFMISVNQFKQTQTMGLIYQSNEETKAEIILRQESRVIHKTFICHQSHCGNDYTLTNVATKNNRHLTTIILKIHGFEALPLEFPTWRNLTRPRRGGNLMKEKLILHNCKQLH